MVIVVCGWAEWYSRCNMEDNKEKIIESLIVDIERLMDHYVCNPNGSDYRCEFCGKTAPNNNTPVKHAINCIGNTYINTLRNL